MERVRVTPELHLEIPNLGTYNMTDWSKNQLASILGIQWNRWFDPKVIKPAEIQEEIQRRFSRTHDQRKLRTSKFKPGSPGVNECDGYLRAVLSPTFHPIDDELVFNRLEQKYGSKVDELAFMRNHLSKKAKWGNDHANHYTLVSREPINMGPIDRDNSDENVRRIYDLAEREGKLPTADFVYNGYHMRNSEVGFTAITIDEFSFRLICLNGAMICVGDSRLMYRQHRPIDNDVLDRQLGDVFANGPARWEVTRRNMAHLRTLVLDEPKKTLEAQLKKMEAPKHFQVAAAKAFDLEPLPTMFGVLQAITRAAQGYDDMDQRFEFEALGGRLLAAHQVRAQA
jgi:hypothetical protein